MNEKKPIRRHSTLRRFLMNAGYYSVKGLNIPIMLLFLGVGCVLICVTLLGGLCFIFAVVSLFHMGPYPLSDTLAWDAYVCVFSLCVLAVDYVYCRVLIGYTELPKGHFLNPLPPAVNEILPDTEVLVRPSSVSETDQKKTLLRPAVSDVETDPQTLLRAANGTDGKEIRYEPSA